MTDDATRPEAGPPQSWRQPSDAQREQPGPGVFRAAAPDGHPVQQPPQPNGHTPPPFGPGPGAPWPQQPPGQRPVAPGQLYPGARPAPFLPGPEYTGGHQPPLGMAPAPKPPRKPLARSLWVGVLIGAVAASLIAVPLTLLSVGRLLTPTLDRGSVQTGVAQVLKRDFGLTDVERVQCPGDQPAVTGTRFECTFSYNSTTYPVAVEVINDQGQYRVGVDAPKR